MNPHLCPQRLTNPYRSVPIGLSLTNYSFHPFLCNRKEMLPNKLSDAQIPCILALHNNISNEDIYKCRELRTENGKYEWKKHYRKGSEVSLLFVHRRHRPAEERSIELTAKNRCDDTGKHSFVPSKPCQQINTEVKSKQFNSVVLDINETITMI